MTENLNLATPDSTFDWDLYADGWNGVKRQSNEKVRKGKKRTSTDIVYSHEKYAQDLYNRLSKINAVNVKDAKKGDYLPISDMELIDENTMSVVVGDGAGSIVVDLTKEDNLFKQFSVEENQALNKESFIECFKKVPEFKQNLLSMNLVAKLGTDIHKGSIWDGYVAKYTAELKEQIQKQEKAYYATVISTTPGGFVVDINNTIRAFMPGSMASSNKINDYESYVGRKLEVMVESWTPKNGFVVSRKKFINKCKPHLLWKIDEESHKEPDKIYHGKITGSTPFGVFVELDEFITGMLHKSLVSDELRDRMRKGEINIGDEIDVYIARIDHGNGRVILSDVVSSVRSEVEAKRKAEDEAEKQEYVAQRERENLLKKEQKQKEAAKAEREKETVESEVVAEIENETDSNE